MHSHKIDKDGNYLPYPGITCLSMVNLSKIHTMIEEYINHSTLGNYYKALPAKSYHMTVFNMWAGRQYKKFKKDKSLIHFFDSMLSRTDTKIPVKVISINYAGTLSLLVKILFNEDKDRIKNYRENAEDIFELSDNNLIFHITLGYLYKSLPYSNAELNDKIYSDIYTLWQMLPRIWLLDSPRVYTFLDMTRYIKYSV